MTNTTLLRQKIDESGYKLKFLAEKCGLTYYGLMKKVNNETEFKASEIKVLCLSLVLTTFCCWEWAFIVLSVYSDHDSVTR